MEFLGKYYGIIIMALVAAGLIYSSRKKKRIVRQKVKAVFPETWRQILVDEVEFYSGLETEEKLAFETRIKRFLATKKITAIDTEIDDHIRLLAACSAIIPMIAFPKFNYPNVKEVLIYPNSFNHKFQTDSKTGKDRNIAGMVGNQHMNGIVILSKRRLLTAFADKGPKNVGIHEFVHLIDMMDGAVDGVPEILMKHAYAAPWIEIIREEMKRIEKGHSDINSYALTNDAEFLAVVSEYFFDKPEKLERKHPELYEQLARIFQVDPAEEE